MIKQLRAVLAGILTVALLSTLLLTPVQLIAAEADGGEDAGATTAAAAMQTEITPFDAMTHVVRRLPNTYFAATTGFLDPSVELPATIEIAIPAGSAVIWFGEPSPDLPITSAPRFEEPFTMRTEGGFDIYTATLETFHQAQIEYNLFFNPVAETEDGNYIIRMEYTPLTDLQALRLITNLPQGSELLDSEGIDWVGINDDGEHEYARTFRDVSAGELVSASIGYSAPQWMGTPNQSRVADGLIITAVAAIGGIAVALGFVIVAKRRRAANAEHGYDYE